MKNITPNTIRGRLLVWLLTSITLIFILLGTLVSVVIWRVLHDQIDHHLHTVITEATQVVNMFPSTERNTLLESFVMQRGMTVTILANDGFPLVQTNSSDVAKLSVQAMQFLLKETPPTTINPVHFNVNEMRFATLPLDLPEGKGLIAIGYSLKIVDQTFRNILIIAILMLIILLGLTTFGIQTLLTKFLEPIEVMAAEANAITHSKDIAHRISIKAETAELSSLIQAINSMLDRLNAFFQNEHQFFSDAAHSLKTPLAITRSYLESTRETKEQKLVLLEINRASETIQDLILISRMNSNEKVSSTKVSLSDLMNELAEISTVLALEKNQKIVSHIFPNITMTANISLLRKALSNVIYNAINYTPDQGVITLFLSQNENQITIKVSDTGIGIPAKDRSRIFNRFYRGSNVKNIKGTGLGLAMVKAIVEALNGQVSIESNLGHGTQVRITFNE